MKKHVVYILVGIAVVSGAVIAWWGIPFAYAERGYFALGGEWLLVLAAFAVCVYVCPLALIRPAPFPAGRTEPLFPLETAAQ